MQNRIATISDNKMINFDEILVKNKAEHNPN